MQIGIFKGEFQYDAVNVFADHLGAAFARAGVTPRWIDLNGSDSAAGQLTRWLASQADTLGFLGFNGIALYERVGGEEVRIGSSKPYGAWLVDHPVMHMPRVARLAGDLVITIDEGHAAFLRRLGLAHVLCLAHACARIDDGQQPDKPWSSRPMRLFMPGSLSDADALSRTVAGDLDAKLGAVWAQLFRTLVHATDLRDDRALEVRGFEEAERLGLPGSITGVFCYVLHQAIMTLRHRRRLEILRKLDAEGIPVDLAGKGCDAFGFRHHRIHPIADFHDTIKRFEDARFVLHINPLFSEAMHERAAYAAMAGAAVVTDGNRMLKRELAGGRGVVFDPDDIEALGQRLERLERTGEGAAIAAKGQRLMADRHTWDHRAGVLIEALTARRDGRSLTSSAPISGPAKRTG